jgi:hypothetical protein
MNKTLSHTTASHLQGDLSHHNTESLIATQQQPTYKEPLRTTTVAHLQGDLLQHNTGSLLAPQQHPTYKET